MERQGRWWGQWEYGGKMRGWYFSFSNVTIKDLQGLILANNHEIINDPFRVRIFLVFENRDIDKRWVGESEKKDGRMGMI